MQMYVFFRILEFCRTHFLHIYFFIRKSVYLFCSSILVLVPSFAKALKRVRLLFMEILSKIILFLLRGD